MARVRPPRGGCAAPSLRRPCSVSFMSPAQLPADRRAAEIIQTWLDGAAPPDAALALANNPELAAEKAVVLDLAFAEFLLREHMGEQLDPEAFCTRFPDYHASLGRMIAQQSVGER